MITANGLSLGDSRQRLPIQRIFCVTRDRQVAQQVRQVTRLSSGSVEIHSALEFLGESRLTDVDLLIIDARVLTGNEAASLPAALGGADGIIVGATQLDAQVVSLLRTPPFNHVLGGRKIDEVELLATICKLRDQNIFGLERYLPQGSILLDNHLRSYEDKRACLDWLTTTARRIGCTRRAATALQLAVEEILLNALYRRQESGELGLYEDRAPAHIRWGYASGSIHVAVTDDRGTFGKEQLVNALGLMLDRHAPDDRGRGLQIAMTLGHRLVVNTEPGVRTEVILSVHLAGPSRDQTSVSFFAQREPKAVIGVERRRNDRITIEFGGMATLPGGSAFPVSLVDISPGGALLVVDRGKPATDLVNGAELGLVVQLAVHAELSARGRVVRIEQTAHATEVGLEFTSLGPRDRDLLLRLAEGQIGD